MSRKHTSPLLAAVVVLAMMLGTLPPSAAAQSLELGSSALFNRPDRPFEVEKWNDKSGELPGMYDLGDVLVPALVVVAVAGTVYLVVKATNKNDKNKKEGQESAGYTPSETRLPEWTSLRGANEEPPSFRHSPESESLGGGDLRAAFQPQPGGGPKALFKLGMTVSL